MKYEFYSRECTRLVVFVTYLFAVVLCDNFGQFEKLEGRIQRIALEAQSRAEPNRRSDERVTAKEGVGLPGKSFGHSPSKPLPPPVPVAVRMSPICDRFAPFLTLNVIVAVNTSSKHRTSRLSHLETPDLCRHGGTT